MNFIASPILNALGSIGPFSSRVFLPAFITALLLRFGPQIPVLHHFGMLAHLAAGHPPTWFTCNTSLIILGILAGLEVGSNKNPEFRQILHEIDLYAKPALAALTSFGVISVTDASFVRTNMHQAAGFGDLLAPIIAAVGTFGVAFARRPVVVALFDQVDGTGVDKLFSWLEELWATFGILLVILAPLVMLVMILIATGILFAIRKHLEALEESSRIHCVKCSNLIYPCAIHCYSCRTPVAAPAAIGFLGQSKHYAAADPATQPYRLVEKRRCPVCANRLKARRPFHPCEQCGNVPLADDAFAQNYIAFISRRVPVVLLVCALLSFVPIFGLIVGLVYSRMELVLPFSQYLPLGKRFLLRWGIRILFLVLFLLQLVPILGAAMVPLMAIIGYTLYRNSFSAMLRAPRPPLSPPEQGQPQGIAIQPAQTDGAIIAQKQRMNKKQG